MDFNHLGLQNCYKFDNNFIDSCGGITGVPAGGVSFDTGKVGPASVRFNGVAGSNVSLANIVCRSFKTGFSLSCWFNIDAYVGTGEFPFLISKSTDEETGNIYMLGITRTGTRRIRFGVTTKSSGYSEIAGTSVLATGIWHFAMVTYDVTSTVMNIYHGGTGLENTLTISGPSGPDIRILGTVVGGTTHAVEAGANRMLIFAASNEQFFNITATGVTYGGLPMILINQVNIGSGFNNTYTSLWCLFEVDIATAVGSTFVVTWSGAPSSVIFQSAFYGNVDQITPTGYNSTAAVAGPTTVTTATTTPNDGNMMIINAVSSNTSGFDDSSLVTFELETVTFNASMGWAYELGADVAVTPSFMADGSPIRLTAISVELLKVGGGNGTETVLEDNTVEMVIGGISAGAATPNGVPTLDGRIDQAIIWNKSLTLEDFNSVYNAGLGEQFPELQFRFDRRPENNLQTLNSRETATDMGIGGGAPVSFSFWCYIREDNGGGVFFIGNDITASATMGLNDGSIFFVMIGGATTTLSPINLNEWNYITMTYDGSDIAFYTNGSLLFTSPQVGTIGDNNPLLIGYQKITPSNPLYFRGSISDFRIYDRALSPSEVQTIHTAQGVDNIREGLIRQWFTTRETIKSTEAELGTTPTFLTSISTASDVWAHVAPAGANRLLVVTITNESTFPLPDNSVMGVNITYGGIELNKVRSFTDNNTNRFQQMEYWTLTEDNINRAGSSVIVVTWDDVGSINLKVNVSAFFSNIAQHGLAKYSLSNSFNGKADELDLKGTYGDTNDLVIAAYTAAQADVSPALTALNGYTKREELIAGVLGRNSLVTGLFTKLIAASGGGADYPHIQNALVTTINTDRQSILVIVLSPATNTVGVTTEDAGDTLENGNQVRYTEDVLRIL